MRFIWCVDSWKKKVIELLETVIFLLSSSSFLFFFFIFKNEIELETENKGVVELDV